VAEVAAPSHSAQAPDASQRRARPCRASRHDVAVENARSLRDVGVRLAAEEDEASNPVDAGPLGVKTVMFEADAAADTIEGGREEANGPIHIDF
jgi:hypothetical protein